MDVAVSEAKTVLTDLVRRAEAGEEVVLTRHGRPVARIVPVVQAPDLARRAAAIERVRAMAHAHPRPGGVPAERSADFLYDGDGLPG